MREKSLDSNQATHAPTDGNVVVNNVKKRARKTITRISDLPIDDVDEGSIKDASLPAPTQPSQGSSAEKISKSEVNDEKMVSVNRFIPLSSLK